MSERRHTLLVVDDNEDNRDMLSRRLLRKGYEVLVAEDGMDLLADRVLALRYQSDRYPPGIPQATLARFIEDGHFGRHLRRTRELAPLTTTGV